jgi:hypothetical protein
MIPSYLDTLDEFREDKKPKPAPEPAPVEKLNLLKAMQGWVNAWPNQPTGTDIIRASGIYFTCPREFILNYWQPTHNKSFDWKSQFMMSVGSHIHDYMQNVILGPMGVLKGTWSTGHKIDDTTREGFHPDPDRAVWEIQHQVPLSWKYVEIKLWDEAHRISGHMDGIVCLDRIQWLYDNRALVKRDLLAAQKELSSVPEGEEVLFELKGSGSYVFDKVSGYHTIAPYYKQQASCYQAMSGIHRTVFWYLNRDSMAAKAFIYPHEPELWEEAKSKARTIWTSIKNETLPKSMMACKMPTDKRAKACTFKGPCWNERLKFSKYVEEGKERAEKEGRKLLDLSDLEFKDE